MSDLYIKRTGSVINGRYGKARGVDADPKTQAHSYLLSLVDG